MYIDLMDFDALNSAEQALLGTWELANEVYNGGFMQHFHNASREHAHAMVGVLRMTEAQEAASILESAIALVGPGTAWGDEPNFVLAINSLPGNVKQQLSVLGRRLYDCLDHVHLLVFRYLSNHREDIDAPENFWTEDNLQ